MKFLKRGPYEVSNGFTSVAGEEKLGVGKVSSWIEKPEENEYDD